MRTDNFYATVSSVLRTVNLGPMHLLSCLGKSVVRYCIVCQVEDDVSV